MKRDETRIGAVLSYVIIALNTITGLLYTPFMLRQLGQSEYGLYMLIGSLVGYISILDFGLHNTIYRFISKYQAEEDQDNQEKFLGSTFMIYSIITILVLIVGGILYLNLGSIFSQSLTSEELHKAKIMFAILAFNIAMSLPMGAFQFIIKGYGRFIFVNIISILRIIFRTTILVGILMIGYKAIAIVVIDTMFNIATGIICAFYCFVKLKVKFKANNINKQILLDIFNYSIFVFILALVNQFFWKLGQVALGIITSTVTVAIYALSINLVMYYQQFALGISGVLMPKVTNLIAKGATGAELTNLMIKVGRIQLSFLGIVLTGFIVLGRQFVLLWAGEEYKQVYWITLIIFIPLTITMMQTVGGVILQAKNMQSFKAKTYLLMSIINIISSLYFGKIMGALGVGIATSISILLFQVIIINIYYKKRIELNITRFFVETTKGILPSIILTLVFGFGTLFLPGEGWLSFCIRVILIMIVYMFTLISVGFNKSEKQMFINPILLKLKIKKVISDL